MTEKSSLSIIGVGAFARFILPYLAPYFNLYLHDKYADIDDLTDAQIVDMKTAATCDIVVFGVPVQVLEEVVKTAAPHIKSGQLVMDITSVKLIPQAILERYLDKNIDIVGLHPMFGPQSGKHGIEGLNITAVDIAGGRYNKVCNFLSEKMALNVIQCTADIHDRDMAYVQGLTHLIAKTVVGMNVPKLINTTKTYDDLVDMVDLIKNDSDALFEAIQAYNPHASDVRERYLKRISDIHEKFKK